MSSKHQWPEIIDIGYLSDGAYTVSLATRKRRLAAKSGSLAPQAAGDSSSERGEVSLYYDIEYLPAHTAKEQELPLEQTPAETSRPQTPTPTGNTPRRSLFSPSRKLSPVAPCLVSRRTPNGKLSSRNNLQSPSEALATPSRALVRPRSRAFPSASSSTMGVAVSQTATRRLSHDASVEGESSRATNGGSGNSRKRPHESAMAPPAAATLSGRTNENDASLACNGSQASVKKSRLDGDEAVESDRDAASNREGPLPSRRDPATPAEPDAMRVDEDAEKQQDTSAAPVHALMSQPPMIGGVGVPSHALFGAMPAAAAGDKPQHALFAPSGESFDEDDGAGSGTVRNAFRLDVASNAPCDENPARPEDPVYREDHILNSLECEVAWLAEESMYALYDDMNKAYARTIQWDYVYEYATESLRVELRQIDTHADDETIVQELLRDCWVVRHRFSNLREGIRAALERGYRRDHMGPVLASLRLLQRSKPPEDRCFPRIKGDFAHLDNTSTVADSLSIQPSKTEQAQPVEALDPKTMKVLHRFHSKRAAEETLGISRKEIQRVLRENCEPVAGGYYWRHVGDQREPMETAPTVDKTMESEFDASLNDTAAPSPSGDASSLQDLLTDPKGSLVNAQKDKSKKDAEIPVKHVHLPSQQTTTGPKHSTSEFSNDCAGATLKPWTAQHVVGAGDDSVADGYHVSLLKHFKVCHFSQRDRLEFSSPSEREYRLKLPLGHPGLECCHCHDADDRDADSVKRRFFWPSLENMKRDPRKRFGALRYHLDSCPGFPDYARKVLKGLQNLKPTNVTALAELVWERLNGRDPSHAVACPPAANQDTLSLTSGHASNESGAQHGRAAGSTKATAKEARAKAPSKRVVFEKDLESIDKYHVELLSHFRYCELREVDRSQYSNPKDRETRQRLPLGHPGLQCHRCKETRFFWKSLDNLTDHPRRAFGRLRHHLDRCNEFPADERKRLQQLGSTEARNTIVLARRIWNRLHFQQKSETSTKIQQPNSRGQETRRDSKTNGITTGATAKSSLAEALQSIPSDSILTARDAGSGADIDVLILGQFKRCRFEEEDRPCFRNRLEAQKRASLEVGFAGIGCRHCEGRSWKGRFFFNRKSTLRDNSRSYLNTLKNHLVQCECDDNTKHLLEKYGRSKSGNADLMELLWGRIFPHDEKL